uniref:Protein kinase domain-containing protein n=1 Tax=Periophthalmus magnuspinnatus TaxID=409849 RepID=A0A3B3ZWY7_9GOBI
FYIPISRHSKRFTSSPIHTPVHTEIGGKVGLNILPKDTVYICGSWNRTANVWVNGSDLFTNDRQLHFFKYSLDYLKNTKPIYNKMASIEKKMNLAMNSIVSGSFGSYQIKEIKGEGSYGCVALCTDMSTNQDVAMKICQRQKSGTNRHEANVLRKLRYMSSEKNLVRFHTAFEYQDHYCLVLEHLDQSLFDLMESEDFKPFHVSDIRYITEQLLVTFKELAKRGFIHGDLKPDNIMLVNHRLQPFKIKLIDFGLSMPVRSLVPGYIFQSIGYRAPEVSLGTKINEAIDMWGLGCVLAFLYLGQNFFPVHCEYEMMRIITQTRGMPDIQQLLEGEFGLLFFKRKKEKTRQFFEFLNKLLEVNPAKRITPEKALTHSFITQEAHTQKAACNISLKRYLRSINWWATSKEDGDTSSESEKKICTAGTSNNKTKTFWKNHVSLNHFKCI